MVKFTKIRLPDVESERKMGAVEDPAVVREHLKKRGILPTGPSTRGKELPMYVSCSMGVFDEFIPPESADYKVSIATDTKEVCFLDT